MRILHLVEFGLISLLSGVCLEFEHHSVSSSGHYIIIEGESVTSSLHFIR